MPCRSRMWATSSTALQPSSFFENPSRMELKKVDQFLAVPTLAGLSNGHRGGDVDLELKAWAELPESVKTTVMEMVTGYSSSSGGG